MAFSPETYALLKGIAIDAAASATTASDAAETATGAAEQAAASAAAAAANSGLAPAFDSTATYAVGDLVLYDGAVYRFTAAHTGAWDAADVEQTTLGAELTEKADKTDMEAALDLKADKTDVEANEASIEYLKLREEEDRQMILGSVAEVVEDTYDELRSAPIHTAITIGQSVYPRMDRTRMAIDRLLGRTVAFNQMIQNGNFASTGGWTPNKVTLSASGNKLTATMTSDTNSSASIAQTGAFVAGHKYLITGTVTSSKANAIQIRVGSGVVGVMNVADNTRTTLSRIYSVSANGSITIYLNDNGQLTGGDTVIVENVMAIDLTAMYGTTLADQIYAMEQATPGAGVAYVRQRLPLDYYAYNAGELTAPVVSGWSVTDTDEHTTTLSIPSTTLNGVGTAQDYIEAVEVAENDYSLIKHTLMGSVDLGTLNFTFDGSGGYYEAAVSGFKLPPDANTKGNIIHAIYENRITTAFSATGAYGITLSVTGYLRVKTSGLGVLPSGYLIFELATPTETTIAEHLTLAEVSLLAENGGIIGIVNSNGDIVQPDLAVDTVISKSAS